jgi:hypothetical protein
MYYLAAQKYACIHPTFGYKKKIHKQFAQRFAGLGIKTVHKQGTLA